jgi:hypothetical protein
MSEIYERSTARSCWKSFRRQVLEITQTDTVETLPQTGRWSNRFGFRESEST